MGAVLKALGFIGGQGRQIHNTRVRTSAAFVPVGWEPVTARCLWTHHNVRKNIFCSPSADTPRHKNGRNCRNHLVDDL